MSGELDIAAWCGADRDDVIDLILAIQQGEFELPITLDDQPDLVDPTTFYGARGGASGSLAAAINSSARSPRSSSTRTPTTCNYGDPALALVSAAATISSSRSSTVRRSRKVRWSRTRAITGGSCARNAAT